MSYGCDPTHSILFNAYLYDVSAPI